MSLVVSAIAAMDSQRVIGNAGGLPWHLPSDLKHFSQLTTGHTVLMGRKTYLSLPERYRPLPKRQNVVVSRQAAPDTADGAVWISDPVSFLKQCRAGAIALPTNRLWVIGGEALYRGTLAEWDEIELTLIDGRYAGDTFFPEFESEFELVSEEPGRLVPGEPAHRFMRYARRKAAQGHPG